MKTKSTLPAGVDDLRQRLDSWRQSHRKTRRLPESLWDAATPLARTHGISAVALALRLSDHRLKKRVVGAGHGGVRTPKPALVEVALVPPACGSECTIELQDRTGSTMSLRLGAGAAGPLVALAQAFWRRRS